MAECMLHAIKNLPNGHGRDFVCESFTLNLRDKDLQVFTLNSVELRGEDKTSALLFGEY